MSTHKFNHTWIERLPYSSKRKVYIDSAKNTQFTNCDFILVVGARTKTAYLRYRPVINGKRKPVLKKLGDANISQLADLRESYIDMAMEIRTKESPLLSSKETREVTIGHLIDYYLSENSPSDIDNMLRFKNQTVDSFRTVGDLVCLEQDVFTIKDILKEDVDKGSLYVANQKREFLQRVWNYALNENRDYNKVLKSVSNPASFSMSKWCGFVKKASNKHLPLNEYPQFFEALDSLHRSDFKDLLYMFLFTGQHPYSEVCKMRWDQIVKIDDQYWWMMEEGFHKVQTKHSLPLHPVTMKIIDKYKGNDDVYVFKNLVDKKGLHDKHTFKNAIRRLKRTHNITWDIRCLRASFITTIGEINPSFRAGILTNQAGQNITEKVYHRGDITYYDFKVDMINAYMELIQDKQNEVSK
ncbi:MAG: hypothetical protein HOF37_10130 [Rhodobacterales bacterium]|jgi:integrase|nr:hypothetical protein [Rhodobacterales bacterium]MBT4974677.1 hypothetical protein [Gammaproteobacteria bacterium]